MPRYRLVILGDAGVGKTALTMQLCSQQFVKTYDPTIQDLCPIEVDVDGQKCTLEILDTAGMEEYAALRDQGIKNGDGFVLVYSILSRSSFSCVEKFKQQMPQVEGSSRVPVILVGNKSDREEKREVSIQEGHALAKELGWEFTEASAKQLDNVELAFHGVVRLLRRQQAAPSKYSRWFWYFTQWISEICCIVA